MVAMSAAESVGRACCCALVTVTASAAADTTIETNRRSRIVGEMIRDSRAGLYAVNVRIPFDN